MIFNINSTRGHTGSLLVTIIIPNMNWSVLKSLEVVLMPQSKTNANRHTVNITVCNDLLSECPVSDI